MIELQTKRLLLNPINIDEAEHVTALITQNISATTSLIPWPYKLEDARRWLSSSHPWERLGLYLDSKLIGTIGTPLSAEDEIGYFIGEEFQNQGYMFEAATAVINFAFENIALNFISSSTHTQNEASIKLHEKLGFKRIRETTHFWPNKGRDVPVILWRLEKPKV